MPAEKKKRGRPPGDPAQKQDKQVKYNVAKRAYALWYLAKREERWTGPMSHYIKWVMDIHLRDLERDGWKPPADPIAAVLELGLKLDSDEEEAET